MADPQILVINPGSTSTRIALFQGETCTADQHLACPADALQACASVVDQIPMRTQQVTDFLLNTNTAIDSLSAIAARGGPLRPVPGGVYRVNEAMLADARSDAFVEHVSKIACIIAVELGHGIGVPAFITDPVSTDEYAPISRLSGMKNLPRKSLIHALNLKAVARLYAKEQGRAYEEMNLITAQLGGGCSIAMHKQGRMVDSVDANGEGPFSPERSGGLRVDSLARFVLESGQDFAAIRRLLTREGGLMSHLGTTDAKEALARAEAGDADASLALDAMAYGLAKHICALAAAVNGRVDAILLTGGLANATRVVESIQARVEFLAPVRVMPGEYEMPALAGGALRVLQGAEPVRVYPTGEPEA